MSSIDLGTAVVNCLIGLRFPLKPMAASRRNAFAPRIYLLAASLLAGFDGLTDTPASTGASSSSMN